MEPDGEFSPEPTHILEKREVQLRNRTMVQSKVQWKQFKADKDTWENNATMRKDFPTLFHDIIMSP